MKQLTILFFLFFGLNAFAQSDFEKEVQAFQEQQNLDFRNPEESPLSPGQRAKFKELSFFPIKAEYRVVARFIKNENPVTFQMTTTTSRRPDYSKYATVEFELNGKTYRLAVYQSHQLRATEKYKDYLFLPFNDHTNGFETYGGGRFIDLSIPNGDTIVIDFNKAYSPSCAFNHSYSCPIPPEENHLEIKIEAGMKNLEIE